MTLDWGKPVASVMASNNSAARPWWRRELQVEQPATVTPLATNTPLVMTPLWP